MSDQSVDVTAFDAVGEEAAPFLAFLEMAKSLPGLVQAKRELDELLALRPGEAALDVGCGAGIDVLEMAWRVAPGGWAAGIDASRAMIAEARRRAAAAGVDVDLRVGDAHALPYRDGTFDACRIETVLQHLAEPERALAEAAAQGRIGRQLPRLCRAAGLVDLHVRPRLVPGNVRFFRLLGPHLARLVAGGDLDPERLARWWEDLERAEAEGSLVAGGIGFVVAGRRPPAM